MWITLTNSVSKLTETCKKSNKNLRSFYFKVLQKCGNKVMTIDKLVDIVRNRTIVKPTEKEINFKEDAALIFFSSGTTVKGVLLIHPDYVVAHRQIKF